MTAAEQAARIKARALNAAALAMAAEVEALRSQVRTLEASCAALLREGFAARRRLVPPPAVLMRMHADAARVPALDREVEVLRRRVAVAERQAEVAVSRMRRMEAARVPVTVVAPVRRPARVGLALGFAALEMD